MASKKVIMFIVEGPTDADALEPVLRKIFNHERIHFHIVHGDITTKKEVSAANIIMKVASRAKQEMDRYGFRKKDILRVLHLIDTDGAFIPDSKVEFEEIEKIKYLEDKILTSDRDAIVKRNQQKTRVVCRLIGAAKVGAFDYSIYYFSRNLEHVFHDNGDDLTDDEKVEYADEAAEKYGTSELFMDFIRSDEIAVSGRYKETWDYIMQGTNSLKRNSNFHLIFEEGEK